MAVVAAGPAFRLFGFRDLGGGRTTRTARKPRSTLACSTANLPGGSTTAATRSDEQILIAWANRLLKLHAADGIRCRTLIRPCRRIVCANHPGSPCAASPGGTVIYG